MDSILSIVARRLEGERIEAALVVGAGDVLDFAYAELGVGRVVLIEGDERSIATLRSQAVSRKGIELVHAVVAPEQGTAAWYRCSLPALNGLVNPDRWAPAYPRLVTSGREDVATTAFREILSRHAGEGRHLLVVDVPGAEDDLFAALPADALDAFEWIAIRLGNGVGGATESAAVRHLEKQDYMVLDHPEAYDEPLWPTVLLRRDLVRREGRLRAAVTSERDRLQETALAQQARIDALCREVEELRVERQHLLDAKAQDAAATADLRRRLASADEQRQAAGEAARILTERLVRAWRSQRDAEQEAHRAEIEEVRTRAQGVLQQRIAEEAAAWQKRLAEASVKTTVPSVTPGGVSGERAMSSASLGQPTDDIAAMRQRRYEDEMLKVGAQMELIKDLLLRGGDI